MARINKVHSSNTVSLEEFVSRVKEKIDISNALSLTDLSEDIQALSNNKEFLIDIINRDLENYHKGFMQNMYSVQSCILHTFDHLPLTLRFNLWPTLPKDLRRRAMLAKVLSYFDCHDHNFSFLTCNYFGPGYVTDLYNYNSDGVHGYIGEKIPAKPLGTYTLNDETVITFISKSDFHVQYPPASLSSSINLMLTEKNGHLIDQYYFDPKSSCITGYVGSESSKRVNCIKYAKYIFNSRTKELLYKIAETSKCVRTKLTSLEVLDDMSFDSDYICNLLKENKRNNIIKTSNLYKKYFFQ